MGIGEALNAFMEKVLTRGFEIATNGKYRYPSGQLQG